MKAAGSDLRGRIYEVEMLSLGTSDQDFYILDDVIRPAFHKRNPKEEGCYTQPIPTCRLFVRAHNTAGSL